MLLGEGALSQQSPLEQPYFVVLFQLQPGVRQLLLIQQCHSAGPDLLAGGVSM